MAVERVAGVESAVFSYEAGTGEVVYDADRTSAAIIIRELERMTGYLGTVRSEHPVSTTSPRTDSPSRR